MKKSALLSVVLVLCATQAWAFEDIHAGYKVHDGNPFFRAESQKLYAFSALPASTITDLDTLNFGSVHIINYYTAKEMEELLEQPFSTAYFNEEYEKMAVLERSDLSLQTASNPLLNIAKYNQLGNENANPARQKLLEEKFAKLEPIITLGKINGQKAIQLSYFYEQEDELTALNISITSANDRLYLLTTVTANRDISGEDLETDDEELEEAIISNEDNIATTGFKSSVEVIQKVLDVRNVPVETLDPELLTNIEKAHKKFIKSFKFLTPVVGTKTISYTDKLSSKTIILPHDWFYGQMQIKEKDGMTNFAIAASVKTVRKISNNVNYLGILEAENLDEKENNVITGIYGKHILDILEAEARKGLKDFDAILFTGTIKNKLIKCDLTDEFLETPHKSQLEVEDSFKNSFKRLKAFSNVKYFNLTDYDYISNFTNSTALVNINAYATVLEEFPLNSTIRINAKEDCLSLLCLIKANAYKTDPELAKSIDAFQF